MAEFEVVEQREWITHMRGQTGEIEEVVNTWERRLPEAPELEDLFVRQAVPTRITPSRRVKPTRSDKLTAIVPDVQIGYRKIEEGNYEPFHDDRAISLAHLAIRETMPDEIVVIGDLGDFSSLSRWEQRSDWAGTVQKTIDRMHTLLAQLRSDAPDANIVLLGANHEARWENSIRNNAAELLGIKRANAGSELGILTLEFLLRLGELEITHLEGYPNSRYWIQPNIQAMHGKLSRPSGQTSSSLVNGNTVSTVQGHAHRLEVAYRTIDEYEGARNIWGMVVGTLSRIDGGVPSGSYTTDQHNRTVARPMNWQQGMAFVESNERVSYPQLVPITEEGIHFNGKTYNA